MPIRRNSLFRYFICVLSVLLFFTLLLPHKVNAENNNSVSLVCRQDSEAVEDMRWRIYKVGEKKDGLFYLTGVYKDYPINLRDMSADNIAGSAKAMESFIIGSGEEFLAESYTDAKGTVSFPQLETGLYFALAKSVSYGEFTYRADPIFFEVTDTGTESQIFPKIYTTGTLADEISNLVVKKVWEDDNNSYLSRTESVTVDIYKDGEYAETVILNEANNWKYSWKTEDHKAEWRVVERYIPKKYQVHIDYNLSQYLIKNTYVPEILTDSDYYIVTGKPLTTTSTTSTTTTIVTDTTTSAITDSTTSTTSVEGGTATNSETTTSNTTDVAGGTGINSSVSTTVTTNVSSSGKPKLPQTGQLWWPVPILLGGGFLLLIIALFVKPKKNKKDQ